MVNGKQPATKHRIGNSGVDSNQFNTCLLADRYVILLGICTSVGLAFSKCPTAANA